MTCKKYNIIRNFYIKDKRHELEKLRYLLTGIMIWCKKNNIKNFHMYTTKEDLKSRYICKKFDAEPVKISYFKIKGAICYFNKIH